MAALTALRDYGAIRLATTCTCLHYHAREAVLRHRELIYRRGLFRHAIILLRFRLRYINAQRK